MTLHQKFEIDPKQATASAIKILEQAGVIKEDNRTVIKLFLLFHAKYALVCAKMLTILHTQDSYFILSFNLREFLKNYREEIKTAVANNPQYAAELALAEINLKSASPLIQAWLSKEDFVQHAQHAFVIFRAIELLEKKGFLQNQNNIPKLKALLFQYGEHAYKFATAIDILKCYKILDPNTDFLASDIMKTLIQCPAKDVISFAIGFQELCEANIFDNEHIELLFVTEGHTVGDVGGCLQLLKSADKGTGMLFNADNKLRIMQNLNESAAIWNLMWTINHKLVLDQDNFDMIFKYIKFAKEIKAFIWTGADQPELNQFIQEIDRQAALSTVLVSTLLSSPPSLGKSQTRTKFEESKNDHAGNNPAAGNEQASSEASVGIGVSNFGSPCNFYPLPKEKRGNGLEHDWGFNPS